MTRRNRVFSISALVAFAVPSAACVQILGIDSTTVADQDSGTLIDAGSDVATTDSSTGDASAPDANGPWSCIGNEPAVPAAPSTVTITANITDFILQTPVPGLQITACLSSRDPTCSTTAGSFTSDDAGVANVVIPVNSQGFTGYLEVTGNVPASDGGTEPIIPYIWHFYQAIVQSGTYPLQTFSTEEFAGLISTVQSGATADPAKGHLAVQATDCTNTPAAGLKLSVSPAPGSEGLLFALRGTSETPTAGLDTTDGSGLVGVFNLDPQNTTLSINRTIGSTELASVQSVLIRAGWLTTIRMQPNQ
jgi:hypothetical protein